MVTVDVRAVVFVLVCVWASGCGMAGGRTAAVSGKVTYKGKPLANADVSFSPIEPNGRAATGRTDGSGKFTLGTFGVSDGAILGKYRVSVIARGPDRPPKAGEVGSGMPGEMMPGDAIIPPKYFAPDTSELTAEVKRGGNTVNLDLKD